MKPLYAIIPLIGLSSLGGCIVVHDRPAYVERREVVVEEPPVVVEEYYFVNGHYYYWHPGFHRYEIWVGAPLAGYRIHREFDRLPERDFVLRMHEREHFRAPDRTVHVERYREHHDHH